MQRKTKIILYVCLAIFTAILLWIISYIFSTTDIQLFIEELVEILQTVEGKIRAELIIYSVIQLVFYIISIVLIIKAVIKANFTVPTSKKVYKTCILFATIIVVMQILKFQEQYTNYLEKIELLNSICVASCFILSIIYYFIYRKDDYYVREAENG